MIWSCYDVMGNPFLYNDQLPPGENIQYGAFPLNSQLSGPNGNVTNNTSINDTATGLDELSNLHNSLLVNNALISSGTGQDKAMQMPTTIIRRPWLDMGEGGVPFDPQQTDTLTGVGTQVAGVKVVVPEGYDGVINGFNWNFSPTTAVTFGQGSGDLQAQILRNGAAVRNYDNILMEKGCVLAPRPINPLRIYSGQTLQIVINHLANNLLVGTVQTGLSGYFYPAMS